MNALFGAAALIALLALGIATAIGLGLRPRPAPEYWASLVAWSVQLLAAMAAVFWVGFLGISTPACAPNCDWDLLGYNFQGFMIAAGIIQLASMVLIILLRRRPKVWVVPLAATGLIIVLAVVSSIIAYKAMLFF